MRFNTHSALAGQHAFLSPSTYHWIRYNDQKLRARWTARQASAHGVSVHELAHRAIKLGMEFSKKEDPTLAAYVADGIKYKMSVEQPLFYSDNCFGTADAICFRRRQLRIHDLKTGLSRVSMDQLRVYAAIFCLEYAVDPYDISIELRLYKPDVIEVEKPSAEEIATLMETIVWADMEVEKYKAEEDMP
jgi:hypothetical protein